MPDEHYAKVLRFVNENNMRGRLALHHVRVNPPNREPEPNTLAGKLFVVTPDHPCAAEALDVLSAAGDHICVDTPDLFPRFRRAVTDTGLYKDSDRLAIKDDRRPLKPSEYIYQGDIGAKLDALTAELAEAEHTFEQARQAADDIAAERQQWRDQAAACKAICEQFPQWSQIDTETADGHADRLREQFELLMADNPDVEALSVRAEECWNDIQTLMTRRGAIATRRDDLDGRRTRLMDLQDRLAPAGGIRCRQRVATPLLRRGAGAPGAPQPRAASGGVVRRGPPRTRPTHRKPQTLLRRAGPHHRDIRHDVPRRHPE